MQSECQIEKTARESATETPKAPVTGLIFIERAYGARILISPCQRQFWKNLQDVIRYTSGHERSSIQ